MVRVAAISVCGRKTFRKSLPPCVPNMAAASVGSEGARATQQRVTVRRLDTSISVSPRRVIRTGRESAAGKTLQQVVSFMPHPAHRCRSRGAC